jgi:DNA-directed RNA polymerase I subunit RPA49
MKVDTQNMDAVLEDYTGGIESSVASLPSLEEVLASSTAARPIPRPNLDAKHPAEAYPLSELIPPDVFGVLPIDRIIDAAHDMEALRRLLPYAKQFPAWILTRLVENAQRAAHVAGAGSRHTTFADDEGAMPALGATEDKEDAWNKVRIAYYIGLLWCVHQRPQAVAQKKKLIADLRLDGDAGLRVVNAIYAAFTETPTDASRAVLSSFHQTKLLAYLCALALHLDNFALDHAALARDTNLPSHTIRELFKSLGCTTATIGGEKRLVLKTPFTLPQPRRGKAPTRK